MAWGVFVKQKLKQCDNIHHKKLIWTISSLFMDPWTPFLPELLGGKKQRIFGV